MGATSLHVALGVETVRTGHATTVVTLLALSGCSYEWHAMKRIPVEGYGVPQPQVDVMASEVQLETKGGVKFREGEAKTVKEQLARALPVLIRPRHPEDRAPARYRVTATLERKGNWSYSYIVLPIAPILGFPVHRVGAEVRLEIQIGDTRYIGTGRRRVFAGLYYNYNTREKATAAAFRAALGEAAANAQVAGAEESP